MDEVVVTVLPHPITTFILGFVLLTVAILWVEYKAGRKEVQKYNSDLDKLSNQLSELKTYVDNSVHEVSKKVDSRVDKAMINLKKSNKI